MKISIVKYGMGNVASVAKAIHKLGHESIISSDPGEVCGADFIILPGVGAFKEGMENLHKLGLVEPLRKEVVDNKKPFMGICLGMQLIASKGNEPIPTAGLGWIEGEVKHLPKSGLRIPHLGWNSITTQNDSFYEEFNGHDFYFIHSYQFHVAHPENITMTANYGNEIVAGVQQGNIYATQFHPEKSQGIGLALLKKILDKHA